MINLHKSSIASRSIQLVAFNQNSSPPPATMLFTDKHPELLHEHPGILVAQAIAEAFPCPAK
jgi:hypothetical protein